MAIRPTNGQQAKPLIFTSQSLAHWLLPVGLCQPTWLHLTEILMEVTLLNNERKTVPAVESFHFVTTSKVYDYTTSPTTSSARH
jgi:hypothetical protein